MKEVTVGEKEYGDHFSPTEMQRSLAHRRPLQRVTRIHTLHIDEVPSAAQPDVEGSTLQARFAPPRWRMPPLYTSIPCSREHVRRRRWRMPPPPARNHSAVVY